MLRSKEAILRDKLQSALQMIEVLLKSIEALAKASISGNEDIYTFLELVDPSRELRGPKEADNDQAN